MIKRTSVVLAVALGVAACGGSSHHRAPSRAPGVAPAHVAPRVAVRILADPARANRPLVTHDIVVPIDVACPPGGATMGCAVQPKYTAPHPITDPPTGPKFPDVSDWQGHPNWDAALRSGIYGAVAKIGEASSLDPDVQYNVAAFRRLHMRWSVYLFVRPIGCTNEGDALVNMLHEIGGPSTTGPVAIADEEVPGLAGYAPCIDAAVYRAYHRHITIYTSPGTWSGGSSGGLDGWLASYGPSTPPGCPWGCHVAAWQYTDGQYGYVTPIPGIGAGDVSVAYGLFSAPAPPKSRTICWGKGSTPTSSACRKIEADAGRAWGAYESWLAALHRQQAEARPVHGRIVALSWDKTPVKVPGYRGPGYGFLVARERVDAYWGDQAKAIHDRAVQAHRG